MIIMKVTGKNKALRHLYNLERNIPIAGEYAINQLADNIVRYAKEHIAMRWKWQYHGEAGLAGGIKKLKGKAGKRISRVFIKASKVKKGHDYAPDVEKGTRPHEIPIGNKIVYHPGSRPMFYMRDALRKGIKDIQIIAKKQFNVKRLIQGVI